MNDNNEIYFIPMPTQNPNAPFLAWGYDEDNSKFFKGNPVEEILPISLIIGEPEPHKPEMLDYHPLQTEMVVSDKIKELIEALELIGIQFIPANVEVNKDLYNYWYIYITNRISGCIDMENSKFITGSLGRIIRINKILLNNKELEQIPFEERLIFKFKEFNVYQVLHKSIVDKIMELSPSGVKFWSLSEWDKSAFFR